MEASFNALGPARAFSPLQILFSLLLSFFMSLLLAGIYRHTHCSIFHRGLHHDYRHR